MTRSLAKLCSFLWVVAGLLPATELPECAEQGSAVASRQHSHKTHSQSPASGVHRTVTSADSRQHAPAALQPERFGYDAGLPSSSVRHTDSMPAPKVAQHESSTHHFEGSTSQQLDTTLAGMSQPVPGSVPEVMLGPCPDPVPEPVQEPVQHAITAQRLSSPQIRYLARSHEVCPIQCRSAISVCASALQGTCAFALACVRCRQVQAVLRPAHLCFVLRCTYGPQCSLV